MDNKLLSTFKEKGRKEFGEVLEVDTGGLLPMRCVSVRLPCSVSIDLLTIVFFIVLCTILVVIVSMENLFGLL